MSASFLTSLIPCSSLLQGPEVAYMHHGGIWRCHSLNYGSLFLSHRRSHLRVIQSAPLDRFLATGLLTWFSSTLFYSLKLETYGTSDQADLVVTCSLALTCPFLLSPFFQLGEERASSEADYMKLTVTKPIH